LGALGRRFESCRLDS